MKSILHTIILAALLHLLAACDQVDSDQRLIYVPPAEVARAVLVEDFTGQRCVNCPAASNELEKLIELYGDTAVIVVGIHSGPFAVDTPLRTNVGDNYYNHWGVTAQPGALINRTDDIVYSPALYAQRIANALQQQTPLSISIQTTLDTDTRTLTATITVETSEPQTGLLQVWLTEDNVVSPQFLPAGAIDMEYSHQHVLRASLTDNELGDNISLSPTTPSTATYITTLPTNFNLDNLAIIAFIYNSQGVLQAKKARMDLP